MLKSDNSEFVVGNFFFVSGEQENRHVQIRFICDLIEVLAPLWSTNFYRVHDAQNISKAKL